MTESTIQREIMLACSAAGDTIWRNNTGVAWQGSELRKQGRNMLIINARPVHFGLTKGSSDLIGIRPTIITPEMVCQTVAVFLALEVKTPSGRVSAAQKTFLAHVNAAGGLARVVRGVGDIPG